MQMKVVNARPRRRKFGRPRLLIVGCGDIGVRIVARLRSRLRIIALTSSPQRCDALRRAGVVPLVGNLDDRRTLRRLAAFGAWVIHLAPPPERGIEDRRTRHLLASLRGATPRLVYISTSGVYGDCGGAWTDEAAMPAPAEARDARRLDAERLVRSAGGNVLRVASIYAHDRFPLARLRAGTPALAEADDVFINRIHADDLAQVCIAALWRGRATRVYNVCDDMPMRSGEFLDCVADRFGLDRPPRVARADFKSAVSPMMYSFFCASRRLRNERIKRELRVRLCWPTVRSALASAP